MRRAEENRVEERRGKKEGYYQLTHLIFALLVSKVEAVHIPSNFPLPVNMFKTILAASLPAVAFAWGGGGGSACVDTMKKAFHSDMIRKDGK